MAHFTERMNPEGKDILIISSVSGGGKTTIIRELIKKYPRNFHLAITATTRKPRLNEVDGQDYYFFSEEKFSEYIEKGLFLEYAKVHSHFYGVPVLELEKARQNGKILVLNIDYQGMRTVRTKFPSQTVSIFLLPPSEEEWIRRLRARNTETEEQLQIRIQQGKKELEAAKEFDYRVINDDLQECLREIIVILKKENMIG